MISFPLRSRRAIVHACLKAKIWPAKQCWSLARNHFFFFARRCFEEVGKGKNMRNEKWTHPSTAVRGFLTRHRPLAHQILFKEGFIQASAMEEFLPGFSSDYCPPLFFSVFSSIAHLSVDASLAKCLLAGEADSSTLKNSLSTATFLNFRRTYV